MRERKEAFSLIELLVVLGIMGLIMSAMIPAVGAIRERAERMATSQQLRQLGLGVALYQETNRTVLRADNLWAWMVEMAKGTGMQSGSLYFFEKDPLFNEMGQEVPLVVATRTNSDWKLVNGVDELPAGIVVVSGLPMGVDPSSTPVVWTRGLGIEGRWQESGPRKGIYGGDGGFIVFLDGRVRWFRDLGEDGGRLLRADGTGRTGDIRAALPDGATAMDYRGKVF